MESSLRKSSNYVLYFDLLNIVACFAVVVLHCSTTYFEFREDTAWYFSAILQMLFHWAVPVYFMLTGATLLNYRERYSTRVFFKKRVLRTVVPFLAWSLIMFLFQVFVTKSMEWHGLTDLLHRICTGEIENVYWFFFSLFSVYLCIPALSFLAKPQYTRTLWYLIALWILQNACRPLLARFAHIEVSGGFSPPLAEQYIGYCLLGWLLHHIGVSKRVRIGVYIAGILGVVGMCVGTILLSQRSQAIDAQFTGYGSICNIPLAAAVFLLAQSIDWSFLHRPWCLKLIRTMAGAGFGVYLCHMIVLKCLIYFGHIPLASKKFMLIGSVVIYLFCVLFVSLCRRIPLLRHLFP